MKKCPNCGAPFSEGKCPYCGTETVKAETSDAKPEGRGKRSLPEKILIFMGALWCLICLAAAIELRYWRPAELAATLLLASPGIVLLLIGFRRKIR